MNSFDLQTLLENGENETLAVFEKQDDTAILQTACAMANTKGGRILVGAKERLKPISPQERFNLKGVRTYIGYLNFYKGIAAKLMPSIDIEVEPVDTDGEKKVVLVTVDKYSGSDSVTFEGTSWHRIGTENKAINVEDMGSSLDSSSNDELVSEDDDVIEVIDLDTSQSAETPKQALTSDSKLDVPINKFFSQKTSELLSLGGFATVRDVVSRNDVDLLKSSANFDKLALVNLIRELSGHGLSLGMQVREIDEPTKVSVEALSSERTSADETIDGGNLALDSSDSETTRENVAAAAPSEVGGSNSTPFSGSKPDHRRNASSEELCLNIHEYADALAAFFESANEDLCFGLFGDWGRGKTKLVEETAKRLIEKQYAVVTFKAWKYRTTPECWAYLFEQFVQEGKAQNWRLPFLAAFMRYGPWPLIVAILSGAFSLFLSNYSLMLFQLIGFGASFYLASLYFFQFRKHSAQLKKDYAFRGHADKLGLQAAIGDDLKAVVKAWILSDVAKARNPDDIAKDNPEKLFGLFPTSLYVAGVGLLLWQLAIKWQSLESLGPPYSIITQVKDLFQINPWAIGSLYGLLTIVFVVGPPLLFWPWLKFRIHWYGHVEQLVKDFVPQRILLVVDDLDRCDNDNMLEIIESTMLLLDDDDFRDRVQIVMLVEDRAVEAAIVKKYDHLWQGAEDGEKKKKRIVRENIEKIFLAQLRLTELTHGQRLEVFAKYMGKNLEEINYETVAEIPDQERDKAIANDSSKPDTEPTPDNIEAENLDERQAEVSRIIEDITWHDYEREVIIRAISMSEQEKFAGWGPRSIRCFLTKYQIARAILSSFHEEVDSNELVAALLKADSGEFESDEVSVIERVAMQVS